MRTILCFGDSNTHGCNPAFVGDPCTRPGPQEPTPRFGPHERWTGVLADNLGPEYRVIEEGLPGRTATYHDAAEPFKTGRDALLSCLLSHAPVDLLILMLGTNDLKGKWEPTLSVLERGLNDLIQTAKNPEFWIGGRVGEILLMSPPPIHEGLLQTKNYNLFDEQSLALSKTLAARYQDIAAQQRIHFLDTGRFAETSELDAIHIDAEGHKKMGLAIAQKVKMIYTQGEG